MWESEKLFVRKVFGEVMAIEEKTKKNLSIDAKRLPHWGRSLKIASSAKDRKKKNKKKKQKTEGREITNKREQISSPNNFECLDVPLF